MKRDLKELTSSVQFDTGKMDVILALTENIKAFETTTEELKLKNRERRT